MWGVCNLPCRRARIRKPYAQVDWLGSVKIDPQIVILYVASFGHPANIHNTVDAVACIRKTLERNPKLLQSLMTLSYGYPPITDDLMLQRIRLSKTKRYANRPSPRFSAADYPNRTLIGNDGNTYISLPSGVTFRWHVA